MNVLTKLILLLRRIVLLDNIRKETNHWLLHFESSVIDLWCTREVWRALNKLEQVFKVGTQWRTCCRGMKQDMTWQLFSSRDMPFFAKTFCSGDKILYLQHFAWNSAGLNYCVMKQRQNDFNFHCCIVCKAYANCSRLHTFSYLNPVSGHQLAYFSC